MNIIFLAHAAIKTFNNPLGDNFDRIEMALEKRTATLLKEWADSLLYGNYDVIVDIEKGQKKGKGYGNERIIYTLHSAAYDAKNRIGLPEKISSDPTEFWKQVKEAK